MKRPIHLLPRTHRVTPDTLRELPHGGQIVACDFYVEGIERGDEVPGGYRQGRIFNIDHHAPTPRMRRRVSSTNLALARFEADVPPVEEDPLVVINHIDCDSILSSGIMAGRLEADPRFGEAAIAADHTGAEDDIADLLQGLDAELSRRGVRDYEISFANLERLLAHRQLDDLAMEALDARRRKRDIAEALVARGEFQVAGPLHFAIVEDPIDGEFFPALLPDATLIMVANPLAADSSRWQVKLRLGSAAPPGLSLADLAFHEFDPVYGGRWNAGSNRRGGGTNLDPEAYAERLARRLAVQLQEDGEP